MLLELLLLILVDLSILEGLEDSNFVFGRMGRLVNSKVLVSRIFGFEIRSLEMACFFMLDFLVILEFSGIEDVGSLMVDIGLFDVFERVLLPTKDKLALEGDTLFVLLLTHIVCLFKDGSTTFILTTPSSSLCSVPPTWRERDC